MKLEGGATWWWTGAVGHWMQNGYTRTRTRTPTRTSSRVQQRSGKTGCVRVLYCPLHRTSQSVTIVTGYVRVLSCSIFGNSFTKYIFPPDTLYPIYRNKYPFVLQSLALVRPVREVEFGFAYRTVGKPDTYIRRGKTDAY